MKNYRSVEGIVRFHRGKSNCACCEGNHIFGRKIEITPFTSEPTGKTRETVSDFLTECLITTPDLENKRVRVTFEVIDE